MATIFIPNEILEKLKTGEILFTDLGNLELNLGEPKKIKIQTEYVYIVKSGNWYKIGRTNNIKARLAHYVRHDKDTVVVFYKKCRNSQNLEKIMLSIFPEKRVGTTEWFVLSDNDVKKIISITKTNL